MTARLLQLSGMVVDLVYSVDEVPKAGHEAVVNEHSIHPGGGFNAMVAAKRAGMDVSYGGALGTGPFARIVEQGLLSEAIPSLRPRLADRDQGCCSVMIDRSGERTFLTGDGAEGYATVDDVKTVSAPGFEWTLLSGYSLYYQGSRQAMVAWLNGDAPIANLVFDPSPMVSAISHGAMAAALARATWISANVHEAATLTGFDTPLKSAKALAQTVPSNGGVVVRDGQNGCVIATADVCKAIPPFPVMPIDTNGAGDTHLGSFIARLAAGDDPIEAARYANVAAALSTTRRGPATAPDAADVINAMTRKEAS